MSFNLVNNEELVSLVLGIVLAFVSVQRGLQVSL